MSGHDQAKVFRYVTQLHRDVLKMMAAFDQKEAWYVPQATIGVDGDDNLPWDVDTITRALFPHRDR